MLRSYALRNTVALLSTYTIPRARMRTWVQLFAISIAHLAARRTQSQVFFLWRLITRKYTVAYYNTMPMFL